MLKSHILKTEMELEQFAKIFNSLIKMSLINVDYIKRKHVRAFFNSNNEMVAGYVINLNAPFQYLEDIPQKVKETHPFLKNAKMEELCETTSFWIDRKKASLFDRIHIYYQHAKDLTNSGKVYAIAGTLTKKIMKKHSLVYSELLYNGRVELCGQEKIFWAYKTNIKMVKLKTFLATFPSLIHEFKKLIFKNKFYKQRN